MRDSLRMDVQVSLLGRPKVERGGVSAPPPRGRKVWALLAYLLLSPRPPTRQQLAGLLFEGADDPRAALRWTLAEARRLLGDTAALRGDPVDLGLGPGTTVDVVVLGRGRWAEALALDGLGGELIEGVDVGGAPAFDAWLLAERRHLQAVTGSLLQEAGLALLAAGEHRGATDAAVRAVDLDPFDENAHTLLVRALAAGGDRGAAQAHVRACTALFERDLGVEPTPAQRLAAEVGMRPAAVAPIGGRGAVRAQLDAGDAAITAGAIEAGLQCLRRAVVEAETFGSRDLHAEALLCLGSALIHSVRGRDLEGAAVLHQSIAVADEAGRRDLAGAACRELGFVDVQQGRHERAEVWLLRAEGLAAGDDAERSRITGVRGMAESDRALYPEAIATLTMSADLAGAAGARRQRAWSLSILGRAHLLRGDLERAGNALGESLDLVRSESWTAFQPWPESLAAEIELREGRVDQATEGFDHAFALACHVGDPCWQGVAGRGSALVAVERARPDDALERLHDARRRSSGMPDSYQWVIGYVLDAVCSLDPAWTSTLEDLAARTGMRELLVRAHLHRAADGSGPALDAARLLARGIDNPLLDAALASAASRDPAPRLSVAEAEDGGGASDVGGRR